MANNKRIYEKDIFNGKVYDNKQKSLLEIQQEIQQELDELYGACCYLVRISMHEDEYELTLLKGYVELLFIGRKYFDRQMIITFDYDLYLGNDSYHLFIPFCSVYDYYKEVDEFERKYKLKALKAGADCPKKIEVDDDDNFVMIKVQY